MEIKFGNFKRAAQFSLSVTQANFRLKKNNNIFKRNLPQSVHLFMEANYIRVKLFNSIASSDEELCSV